MKHHRFILFIVSLFGMILTTWIVTAQPAEPSPTIAYHAETGLASFISADTASAAPLPLPNAALSSADQAQTLLNRYAPLFGVSNPAQDLQLKSELQPDAATITRRYQQTFQGVPVFGGELIVNMTAAGALVSMNGEASPNLSLSTSPQVTDAAAQQVALQAIAKWYGLGTADLTATLPSLWIYDARLLKPSTEPVRLVWLVEIKPVHMLPLRELVLVDAATGNIALNFNQVATIKGFATPAEMQQMNLALKNAAQTTDQQAELGARVPGVADLATYTANDGTILPGSPLCTEAQASCTGGSNADADGAHKYAKESYDLFWTQHSRDSIDGAGMLIISSVDYGDSSCNAFWSGSQMVYHNSCFLAVDDVVGHELTHGVTQYTSGLFYYYQSGAINESLSDVWGEALDQLNTSGNDAASVRWHLAEDSIGGGWGPALRYMDNPPEDGVSPDRIQSADYWKEPSDSGGVHINSGVNNKAVYLMVDGGSFNGRTVTGIGYPKVLKVYYRVQTTLLVSGSDYNDLYNALNASCNALVGTAGITANDCLQVKTAAEAVEMNLLPTGDFMPEAAVCPAGQSPTYLFNDNRESGAANYTTSVLTGSNVWNANETDYSHSGLKMIYGENVSSTSDSVIAMNSNVALPAGKTAYLHFDHAFGFEFGTISNNRYDGGILEYSTNGGSSWSNASSLHDQGQDYNGTIASGEGNPLPGQSAFTADSHGYVSSRYDLGSLAGQNIRFRWRIATDPTIGALGWVIDDIKIYTCGTVTPPTPTSTPEGPTGVQILVNGGFEVAGATEKQAAGWTDKNSPTDDKRKCNKEDKIVALQGNCAYQLKGTPGVSSAIQQKVTPVGGAGDTLVLTGWVNAKNLSAGGRIQLKVKYVDDTKGDINLDIPAGTYAYTKLMGNLTMTNTPQKFKVKIRLDSSGGKAYVDSTSLIYTNVGGLSGTLPLSLGQ
jgi:bacillolysin